VIFLISAEAVVNDDGDDDLWSTISHTIDKNKGAFKQLMKELVKS